MLNRRIMIGIPALIALALLSRLARGQTATPTLIPTITAIPAPSATPGPTTFFVTTVQPSTTPGCAAALPLQIGGLAYVSGGVYVRTDPNGSRPWVNYYAENTVVRITRGPVLRGQVFNRVEGGGAGECGWGAE